MNAQSRTSHFMRTSQQILVTVVLTFLLGSLIVAQTNRDALADGNQSNSDFTRYIHPVPESPADYQRITPDERLEWFTRTTIGPRSLAAGLFSAGFGTVTNTPREYGTHWDGFAQRYGVRLTGVGTSNAIEASLGAVWSEDPRYFHTVDAS